MTKQCEAVVYKKDVPRRTGRGKNGFEMHYNRCRCKRNAMNGVEFCYQHAAMVARGWNIMKWNER